MEIYKGAFFLPKGNFFVGVKTSKFLQHYQNKQGAFLVKAVHFKVGCIYKTFGDKTIKFRCKLKFSVGILRKQGLQMLNKGGNVSLVGQFE